METDGDYDTGWDESEDTELEAWDVETDSEDPEFETGKEPNKDIDYLYILGEAWPVYPQGITTIFEDKYERPHIVSREQFDAIHTKYSCIDIDDEVTAIDIVKIGNTSYEFTIKELNIRCRSNYPWAFFENTPENRPKINEYYRQKKNREELAEIVEVLRNDIAQL